MSEPQSPGPSAASAASKEELSAKAQVIEALQQNWRREREGARTYRDMARHEPDPNRRAVLERLAEAEERHAEKWERKLAELGAVPPPLTFNWHDKLQQFINRG